MSENKRQAISGFLTTTFKPDTVQDRYPLETPQGVTVGHHEMYAWIDLPGCGNIVVETTDTHCMVRVLLKSGMVLHEISLERTETS